MPSSKDASEGSTHPKHASASAGGEGLQQTYERLRAITELTHTYAYSLRVTPEGFVAEWVSDTLRTTLGIAPGPLGQDHWMGLVPEPDRGRVAAWFERVSRGDDVFCEHRIRLPDGRTHWVRHRAQVRCTVDGMCCVDGAAQDITDRRLVQEELADSDARFRALADNATHLIVEIDDEGRVLYVNHAIREILGYEPEQCIGSTLEKMARQGVVDTEDAVKTQRRIHGSTAPDGRTGGISRWRGADGRLRWLEFSGRRFQTSGGREHRVAMGRDATAEIDAADAQARYAETLQDEVEKRTAAWKEANRQLRALQAQLLSAERLGVTEELAGAVAHAINNPLAALLGTVEMEIEANGGRNPRLLRVRRLAQRIQAVSSQTLALFREGALDLTLEDPSALLEDLRSEIEERAFRQGVRLHVHGHAAPPTVLDRTLMTAALVSLTENALEASPEGGDLHVDIVPMPAAGILRFTVADRGPGIPKELRDRVFEPFFTTKSAGTGLGLAIALGVIRGHHGRIRIEDRSGGGATVHVDIPLQGSRTTPRERHADRSSRGSPPPVPIRRLGHGSSDVL